MARLPRVGRRRRSRAGVGLPARPREHGERHLRRDVSRIAMQQAKPHAGSVTLRTQLSAA
ncbi:hypothetical protein OH687_35005 [Burkholderia anthina]|nr:hypothetical protein OH687_35005 [Burkholderia anthina]